MSRTFTYGLIAAVVVLVGINGWVAGNVLGWWGGYTPPEGCTAIPIRVQEPGVWACLATDGNEYFEFDNTTGHDAYVCPDGSFGLGVIDTDGKKRRFESNDLRYTCIPKSSLDDA